MDSLFTCRPVCLHAGLGLSNMATDVSQQLAKTVNAAFMYTSQCLNGVKTFSDPAHDRSPSLTDSTQFLSLLALGSRL